MTSASTTLPPAYYQAFTTPQSHALATRTLSPNEPAPVDADQAALAEARQQTYDLRFLEPGWNGYDALPPSEASVAYAMRWLVSSYAECKDAGVVWYKPNVSASAEGEVAFEWWADDRSLIVYVEGEAASFHKALRSDGPTVHTHGDAPLGEGQAELLRWFGE